MSTLALEIDQTLQQLDSATASRLERMVRDVLALVKASSSLESNRPAVLEVIADGKVNGFEVVPAGDRVVTNELVQSLMEEAEAA